MTPRIVIALLLSGAVIAAATETVENLLQNPALEGDTGLPYAWELSVYSGPSPGEIAMDADAGQEGATSLRIIHAPGEDHYTQIRQIVSTVLPAGKYTWRIRAKTENLANKNDNSASAVIGIFDRSGSTVSGQIIDTHVEWQDVEKTFEITNDTGSVMFLIDFNAAEGTLWLEKPSLEPAAP